MKSELPPELASIDTLGTYTPPRVPLPLNQQLRIPPRPKMRWQKMSAPRIEESWPAAEKVRLMVQEYVNAVRRLYGSLPRHVHPGTGMSWGQVKAIQRAGDEPTVGHLKEFEKLSAAAELMCEHEVIPAVWCEWYLETLKKCTRTDKKGKETRVWEKRVPPLSVVFSATAIKKRYGWCRNEMRPRTPEGRRLLVSQLDVECQLRLNEIHRINAGHGPGALTGPPWYVEMRQREIALGHTDPNDLYPRFNGGV